MRPVSASAGKQFRKWKLCSLFFLLPVAAYSNTYNVTVTTDGNTANQLRGAISAAVAAGSGPHIINVSAGTYNLTLGQIVLGNSPITLTIIGADPATTIINMTATLQDRIFKINPSRTVSNVRVTIQNLTFTNGRLTSDNFGGGAILAGGPSNSVIISNCVFNSNTGGGNGGGAISTLDGGTISIDQCSFTGNSCPTGNGGALYYNLPANQTGSLTVTNSIFTNNRITEASKHGGAITIWVGPTSGGTTSAINIQRNTFLTNQANGSMSEGGAVFINNRWGAGNTAQIILNRIVGNTAANPATSGLAMFSAAGNVNAENNWWGCNFGPGGCNNRAGVVSSGGAGTLQIPTWIILRTSSSVASFCSGSTNTATITASFRSTNGAAFTPAQLAALVGVPVTFSAFQGTLSNLQSTIQSNATATATLTSNGSGAVASVAIDNFSVGVNINNFSSPTLNFQPSPFAACPGNVATFSVSALEPSLSYKWFKNLTPLSEGWTASGSYISGSTTATLSIINTSIEDNSSAYNVLVTAGNGCETRSDNAQLIVQPLTIASENADGNGNINVNGFDHAINDGFCNRIALVLASGDEPVTGVVNASVTIDAGQPFHNGQPYVRRHYDIQPTVNPNTATAYVTLYFLQSEFDDYNAAMPGTINDLPTNPGDATGMSNLRVTQYHGLGTNPGNYTGWPGPGPARVLINPGFGNVVWNSTSGWWEVRFPVTGFSGFYVTGLISFPLPVTMRSIIASEEQGSVRINWEVAGEIDFSHYEVETSTDGIVYSSLGTVKATGSTSYSFLHTTPASGINYYRLKLVDIDGRSSYSRVVSYLLTADGYAVQVIDNPFRQNLIVRITANENTNMQLQLTDLSGKSIMKKTISVRKGTNLVTLPGENATANGIYLLQISGGGFLKTFKVMKAE
jgi:hypothetical protein